MKSKLFSAFLGMGVLLVTACAGTPSAPQMSQNLAQVVEEVESYRFNARLRVDQTQIDGTRQQGEVTMQGEFVAPDRLHLEVDGDEELVSPAELLFYDGDMYVKRYGAPDWSEAAASQVALLKTAPSLEEIQEWFEKAVGNESADVSRTELDGDTVHHLRGNWTEENSTPTNLVMRWDGTFDVWTGADDHLLRRAVYKVARTTRKSSSSDSFTGQFTAEVDFFDHNAPILIDAP